MPYSGRRDDGLGEAIVGGLFWLWIASLIQSNYGWSGLAIAAAAVVGGFAVLFAWITLWDKWVDRHRVQAPCAHGTVGASIDSTKCASCIEEKNQEKERAATAARESAEQAAAQRARAYAEWILQIRQPEYLKAMDPQKFELLVCDLFRRLGYEVQSTRYTGDSGVDGYLRKDGTLTILQCKRVKGSVGEPILRDLFGTMHANGAASAVVVTTGKISDRARRWVHQKPIRIIELDELNDLLKKHFSETDIVPPKFNPDKGSTASCPKCHLPLRFVRGRRGPFWGCSGYPTCRYTQSNRFELR